MTSWDCVKSFWTCSKQSFVQSVQDATKSFLHWAAEIVPQPYIGVPGTGALTLTFFGDAGVVGRADIMFDLIQVEGEGDHRQSSSFESGRVGPVFSG